MCDCMNAWCPSCMAPREATEHWHLEGPGGKILCGAKHGIIAPGTTTDPYCDWQNCAAGPICPSCLDELGQEILEIRYRARDRELSQFDAASGGMSPGEMCLDCDGLGSQEEFDPPVIYPCPTCKGEGRVGL